MGKCYFANKHKVSDWWVMVSDCCGTSNCKKQKRKHTTVVQQEFPSIVLEWTFECWQPPMSEIL